MMSETTITSTGPWAVDVQTGEVTVSETAEGDRRTKDRRVSPAIQEYIEIVNPLQKRIADLEAALRRSSVVLDDLLHTYADEFCDEADAKESCRRITEGGGTLAYIASVQQANREILKCQT